MGASVRYSALFDLSIRYGEIDLEQGDVKAGFHTTGVGDHGFDVSSFTSSCTVPYWFWPYAMWR